MEINDITYTVKPTLGLTHNTAFCEILIINSQYEKLNKCTAYVKDIK